MAEFERQSAKLAFIKEHRILFLVLLISFIHGIFYIRLIPPWQHYDEPGHLEYAWLIANRLRLPEDDDYDQSMRREMAASMMEFDFFKGLNFQPNLLSQNEPIWIGYSQIFGLPLYYILVALPLRLIQYSDITFQLYISRSVSLLLYLLTIVAAYGIVREITPDKNPLRWMVPLSLGVLPSFIDVMTAVNDDVGATVVFSMFLWAGVRIIQRGFSWLRLVALAFSTIACIFTKNTVVIAVILAMIPSLGMLFGKVRRRYLWIGIVLLGLLIVPLIFRVGDAASWHKSTSKQVNTRLSQGEAPIGRDAFRLKTSEGIFQIIPQSELSELKGKTVTVGAWMWAGEHTQSQTPSLKYAGKEISRWVEIGKTPTLHTFSTTLPEDLTQLLVILNPGVTPGSDNQIYYDGVILVEGDYSKGGTPSSKNINASQLVWNGSTVNNYIRNASAEETRLVLRSAVNRLLANYVPGSPDLYMSLLQDWRSSAWYYQVTVENLLQTFWGRFGWGHVPLLGKYSYNGLALISIVGFAGATLTIIRHWHRLPITAYLFLFISGMIIWFFTILRGLTSITSILFIPSARYAFPAIIPTILAINMGWLEISYLIKGRINPRLLVALFIIFFFTLDSLAIASIASFYYGR